MSKWFKNKKIRILFAITLILVLILNTIQPAMAATNIIINGTYQTDLGSWNVTNGGNTQITWQASGQANGGAARIRNQVDRSPGSANIRQSFTLTKAAPNDVNFSFWYKKAISSGNGLRSNVTRVRIIKPGGSTYAFDQQYNTTTVAWTQVSTTIPKAQFSTTGTYTVEFYGSYENDGNSPWVEAWFDEVNLEIDQINPNPVTTLNGTAVSETQVDLTWNGVTDPSGGTVAYYDVYKDGVKINGSPITHTGSGQHSYSVTGLSAATSYTFEVKAVDTWQNTSTGNSTVNRSTLDTTLPSSVTGLTASAVSTSQIDLSWNAATDNVGVTGYDIYRDNSYIASVGSGTLSYSSTGLSPSTLYLYEVKAKDAAGNVSTLNSTASATTQAPPDAVAPNAITTLTGTVISGIRVDLQWSAGTDNAGGSGMKEYLVMQNGVQIAVVSHTASPTFNYSVSNLTPNTAYSFEVRPKDLANNIQTTGNNVINKTTMAADNTAPSAVTNLAANTQSYSTIRLTWSASTDNRGISSYEIYQNGSGTPIAAITHNGNPTYSYDVFGLTASTGYTFEVKAVDLDGNKSTGNNTASATTYAPPDSTPPSAVTGLNAVELAARRIEIEWSKSSDNIGVHHYNIYQVFPGSPTLIGSVTDGGATSFRYNITGLEPITTYTFEVKAVDAVGNESTGNWTATATTPASTDPTPPNAITSLTGSAASQTKVKLTWNAGTDNVGVIDYQVIKNGSLLAVVKDNGAPTFTYYAIELTPNTSYSFEVRAVDKEGNISTGNNQVNVSTEIVDSTPPSQPNGLTITNTGNNEVRLVWQAASDNIAVTKYKIYRSENGGAYKVVETTTQASNTCSGLKSSTNYSFKVTALDAFNNESPASAVVSTATTADTSAPEITFYEPNSNEAITGQASIIKAVFNDGLNGATVSSSTVYLRDNNDNPVAGTVSYDDTTNTVKFTPAAALGQGVKYTAYLVGGSSGIKNSAGIALNQTFSWTFKTGSSTFNLAHGSFSDDTSRCRLCHSLHTGQSAGLLKESTQTGMCFTCHDGTGSNYNIASIFASDSGNITAHPVKDTELATGELIRCTDCHNPHGTAKPGGGYYPKLLKSHDGTSYYNEGPNFCLACHGSINRAWSTVYYQNTLGNHTNANAAHFDSSKIALQPASGSKVTCVQCHDQHASSNNRLLRESQGTEDTLCFKCHNNPANSLSSRNIFNEFYRTGSRHNIFDSDQVDGSKVECRSCHGPHTVAPVKHSSGLNISDISDPDNTYNFWTMVPGPRNSQGSLSEFCLKCHDGTPPQKNMSTAVQVPFDVVFPSVNFTSNNTGWNKNPFTTSGHFTGTQRVDCDQCHEQHGSDYPRLQKRAEDTAGADGICLSCHNGTNTSFSNAPNIKGEFAKTYKHPTLSNSGQHSDTENYNNMTVRHAECVDCHDPHSVAADSTTTAPNRSNLLKNVSGVGIGARSAWTSLPSNSNLYTFKKDIAYQYELCYKCHSTYAVPAPSRDISREFNPANASFHPVEGDSPNNNGSFVNGYSATSRVYCTGCHGSGGSIKGPHGSDNPKILKGTWDGNTGSSSSAFCFNCHNSNAYQGGGTGSGFRLIDRNDDGHGYHLEKIGSIRCQWCHSGVLHGNNLRSNLLVTTADPAPFSTANTKITSFTYRPGGYTDNQACSENGGVCDKH